MQWELKQSRKCGWNGKSVYMKEVHTSFPLFIVAVLCTAVTNNDIVNISTSILSGLGEEERDLVSIASGVFPHSVRSWCMTVIFLTPFPKYHLMQFERNKHSESLGSAKGNRDETLLEAWGSFASATRGRKYESK